MGDCIQKENHMPKPASHTHKRHTAPLEARPDELGDDPREVGPDSAGESGDAQGLSFSPDVTGESVEDLAASGQFYEASTVEGIEEAADHPGRPVPIRSDRRPPKLREEDEAISSEPDEALSAERDDL